MVKRSSKIRWEVIAGAIVLLTLAMFLVPRLDDMVMGKDTNTILIRASIKEAGGFDKRSIEVKAGEKITFDIYSMDMTHSFIINDERLESNVNTGPIHTGEHKTVEVVFDEPGEYIFRCGVYCSDLHGAMTGKITVLEK